MKGKIIFKISAGIVFASNRTAGMSEMQSRVWFASFAWVELFSCKILRVYYFTMARLRVKFIKVIPSSLQVV